ncbi:MAG: SufE family protein [Hyphomicrobiales bacterium]
MAAFQELKADFEVLDDWEDRYRHVIELGKLLPPLAEADRTAASKVRGCASQVWIVSRTVETAKGPVLVFIGDSDALIVKGLIAIIFMIFSNQPAGAILATDAGTLLNDLGLKGHLTQQRSNGLASMVERIKSDARRALQDDSAAAIVGR